MNKDPDSSLITPHSSLSPVEQILRDNARRLGADLVTLSGGVDLEHPFLCCPRCDSIIWTPEGDFRRCRRCAELWKPGNQ